MMIIDILTRIGHHPLHEFKQSPEELLSIMDEHGIDKSFLMPFPSMKVKQNNDMIADAVKEHPDSFIGFMCIDPAMEDAIEEIERSVAMGLKGVMIDPEFHRVFGRGMSRLEMLMVPCMDHNLPVLFNTENIWSSGRQAYYKGLDRLAFKFQDVRLVVHFRWPRVEELLRAHRNIILYTGGHHNTPGPIPFIEEVGPMRLCLGSESPVIHPALTVRDIQAKKILPLYRELILGKNAKRLFKDLL
jgi:predicted TIM-barrel fold metal-dependent hydrolase